MDKGTTGIGFINKNRQQVIGATNLSGNDHNQRVYILQCLKDKYKYGANGSDIWQRKCPKHQGGKPGLKYK